MREAIDVSLGLVSQIRPDTRPDALPDSIEDLIARGILKPPREPMRHATHLLKLPAGVTSLDLLDREDRV